MIRKVTTVAVCLLSTTPMALAGITVLQLPATQSIDDSQGRSAVSADGETVMLTIYGQGGYRVALWDVGNPLVLLNVPGTTGEGFTLSGCLTADGNRAVVTAAGNQDRRPYLWERGQGFTMLSGSFANTISANGRYMSGTNGSYPFVQELPIAGGPPGSVFAFQGAENQAFFCNWVSDDGQNIVMLTTVNGGYAVGWRSRSGAASTLPRAMAWSVTATGYAAGARWGESPGAFLGRPSELQMIPAASTAPGASHEAIAVASDGSAMVGVTYVPESRVHWYWTPALGTVPLSRVIGAWPSHLVLNQVMSLSGDGQHVLGSAYDLSTSTEALWMASVSLDGCGTADFNADGDTGTDQDIELFFACFAGSCCDVCVNADVNVDGFINTSDIDSFFRVLGSGGC